MVVRGLLRASALAGIVLAAAGCKNFSRGMKDFAITPSATYWLPAVKGHTQITAGSQPNTSTKADLHDDLGLDGGTQWTARVDAESGPNRIGIEYLPIDLSGSTITQSGFIYHGATYPAGDEVDSELKLTTWVLRYDYASKTNKKTADAMRFGVNAVWWDYDSQVKGSPSGNDERRHFSHVYPGVHGDLTFDMGHNLITNFYGGYATKVLDTGTRIWEVSGALGYKISDAIRLSAGYRWITWDFNESTNDGDFSLRGPYAGLAIRF